MTRRWCVILVAAAAVTVGVATIKAENSATLESELTRFR